MNETITYTAEELKNALTWPEVTRRAQVLARRFTYADLRSRAFIANVDIDRSPPEFARIEGIALQLALTEYLLS